MKWLRKWLGSPQSLIVVYDHLRGEQIYELEPQWDELERYYQFAKLTDVADGLRAGKVESRVCIAFANPRQSVLLHAVPKLLSRQIPFTVFLRPECIGLNKLPAEEELALFRAAYGDRLSAEEWDRLRSDAWYSPDEAEHFLRQARQSLGPLPLDRADPTAFMATWGKVVDIPSAYVDFGLHLGHDPRHVGRLSESLTFIRQNTGVAVRVLYHSGAQTIEADWASLGISAILTNRQGAVDAGTDPLRLPQWSIEYVEDQKNDGKKEEDRE